MGGITISSTSLPHTVSDTAGHKEAEQILPALHRAILIHSQKKTVHQPCGLHSSIKELFDCLDQGKLASMLLYSVKPSHLPITPIRLGTWYSLALRPRGPPSQGQVFWGVGC